MKNLKIVVAIVAIVFSISTGFRSAIPTSSRQFTSYQGQTSAGVFTQLSLTSAPTPEYLAIHCPNTSTAVCIRQVMEGVPTGTVWLNGFYE